MQILPRFGICWAIGFALRALNQTNAVNEDPQRNQNTYSLGVDTAIVEVLDPPLYPRHAHIIAKYSEQMT